MKTIDEYFRENGLNENHQGCKAEKRLITKEKISRSNKHHPHNVKWCIEKEVKKIPRKTYEQKVYMLSMRFKIKPNMAGE